MSTLEIEVNKSHRDFNAMLRFDHLVQGTDGTTRSHQEHVFCTTTPEMRSYFHESNELEEFVKRHVNSAATNSILFSRTGWDTRKRIKKETEDRIEKRTCTLCLLTCGCAICCCGLCDANPEILSEEHLLRQIKEQSGNHTEPQIYAFVSVESKGTIPFVEAIPTAPESEPDIKL